MQKEQIQMLFLLKQGSNALNLAQNIQPLTETTIFKGSLKGSN